jgi:hypothetical protein
LRNVVYLIIAAVAIAVLTSLVISAIYGPSYSFLTGEDNWLPDGKGGWFKHGHPPGPPPSQPSVVVPVYIEWLPVILPLLLIAAALIANRRRWQQTKA